MTTQTQPRLFTTDEVITLAGVTDPEGFIQDLRFIFHVSPEDAMFTLVTLDLKDARGWICSPEDYLMDGDEEGYEKTLSLSDAYSFEDKVPPVVFGRSSEGGLQMVDGLHRLSAARNAGMEHINAFVIVVG